MNFVTNFVTYLKDRAKNLVNDLTELEGALAAVTTIGGTATALTAGNSQAQQVVGEVLAVVGLVSLVVKKATDAINGLH